MLVEVSKEGYQGWFIVEDGKVVNAASLLQFTIGHTYHRVSDALQHQGYKVAIKRTDV